MSKWIRKLDISSVWKIGNDDKSKVYLIADAIAKGLKTFVAIKRDDKLDDLIEQFEGLAKDLNTDYEKFKGIMLDLCDWADTSPNGVCDGEKNCWIKTAIYNQMSLPANGNYTVKNVKLFRAMEGQGFNATLYYNEKKVALVDDAGCGGTFDYTFVSNEEKRKWNDFIKSLPPHEFNGKMLPATEDGYVGHIVSVTLEEKELKRLCKTKTVVKLKGHKNGEWMIYKTPFSPAEERLVVFTHGDEIIEICNNRFIE